MSRVWVLGSANTDITFRVSTIPQKGETRLARERSVATGGKGANQAIAIARLGGTCTFVGCVGNDERGISLREALRAANVDDSYCRTVDDAPSGEAVVYVDDDGGNSILVFPGANHHVSDETMSQIDFESGDILVAQLEINVDAVVSAFDHARSIGATTILNPSPVVGEIDRLLSLTDIVIANEYEAEAIGGVSVNSPDAAVLCARRIISQGPETVIITMGGDGAIVCTREESFGAKPPSVDVVDTQGAGDAFLGAFVVQLVEHTSLVDALRYAILVSSYCVTRNGSTQVSLPDPGDRFLKSSIPLTSM